jgi:hypothetical protein
MEIWCRVFLTRHENVEMLRSELQVAKVKAAMDRRRAVHNIQPNMKCRQKSFPYFRR